MADLTDKQRVFVETYLTCWNATEAAKQAHYAAPGQQGHRLLKNVEIQAEIARRVADKAMTADEVLLRLADQARGSMEDFLDDAGDIDLGLARENKKLHLLKARSITKEGERIELYSAQSALELLARHHGLLVDRQETGPPGAFAPVREVVIEVPSEPMDGE